MSWCEVCCSRHGDRDSCPGRLLATGPERHGRRLPVNVSGRTEIYGVLIAEAGEVWRARVLTYPNMLWSVPGGRGTMKFVGRTAQEAEARALDFLRDFCRRRGLKTLDETPGVDSAPVDSETARETAPRGSASGRALRNLPVRYGEGRATTEGRTSDLSPGGLFIATSTPLRVGRDVRLLVDLDGFTIPLAGRVAWVRDRPKDGRPAGMGVELTNPPAMYVRHVRAFDTPRSDEPVAATSGGDERMDS